MDTNGTAFAQQKAVIVMRYNEKTGMIPLDFGEYGRIEVPPDVALAFVSSAKVKEDIRREIHYARNEITTRKDDMDSRIKEAVSAI